MRWWANVILAFLQVWSSYAYGAGVRLRNEFVLNSKDTSRRSKTIFIWRRQSPCFCEPDAAVAVAASIISRNRYTRSPPLLATAVAATTGAYDIIIISFVELYKRNLRVPVPLDSRPYCCVVFFK